MNYYDNSKNLKLKLASDNNFYLKECRLLLKLADVQQPYWITCSPCHWACAGCSG